MSEPVQSTTSPTAAMRFCHPWRPYQSRVLDELERHLDDHRLHVVAAPGSGKTTLGLELFRRLGRPAVVLSPSLTIRNQWITRLGDFLGDGACPPPWASTRLDSPGYFTSITYQALHTKYRGDDDEDEPTDENGENPAAAVADEEVPTSAELARVAERLCEVGVGTLILDEAHHLRQEWWKALDRIIQQVPGLTVVSLTATPPYDAVGVQWQRYEELCGPIDAEISVPELVRAGTLCPHQDYVWAVGVDADAESAVRQYEQRLAALFDDLTRDDALLAAVRSHPWIADKRPDADEVLEAPEFAVAMMAYLWRRNDPVPDPLLKLLDFRDVQLPPMERRWWQVLVHRYLFDGEWVTQPSAVAARDELAKRLRADGLLYRHELRLLACPPVQNKLSLSPAKIDACLAVHRLERELRREHLRQVILTDFIRDEELRGNRAAAGVRRLGAWPIFRELAESLIEPERPFLAMLTGRLVVIHRDRVVALTAAAKSGGLEISTAPLAALDGFVKVTCPGSESRLVSAMTVLLSAGSLRVLVGTRSLLGEGWDAPPVNSLVLASYVGSFMLTNQMRGRAIRVDRARPGKVSSIWHLLAIDPDSESGRGDLDDLARRFDCFVGLAVREPVVINGLERMALPAIEADGEIAAFNDASAARARQVFELGKWWSVAIDQASDYRVRPQVVAPATAELAAREKAVPVLAARVRRVRSWLWVAVAALVAILVLAVAGVIGGPVVVAAAIVNAIVVVGLAVWFQRSRKRRDLHQSGGRLLRQMGLALRDAMCQCNLIATPLDQLSVTATADHADSDERSWAVGISGGSFYEQALFADCAGELLGPIENPRYLLVRRGEGLFAGGREVHAVPQLLGVNRHHAEQLELAMNRHRVACELVYTRTDDGRKQLLKLRGRSLWQSAGAPLPRRRDRWQ